MLISNLIRRIVRDTPGLCLSTTLVEVSTAMFDLAYSESGSCLSVRNDAGERVCRIADDCLGIEVWEKRDLSGTHAVVASMNVDFWSGDLCRSNHERLLFDARLEELLNDRLLAMPPDEALKEAQANGEDSSGNVFEVLGLSDAEGLFNEAVHHIRAWVAWCDGPADPHPLDSLRDAKAFLAWIDEGGQG